MADRDIELMAHLMRRAGFGANRDELEAYVEKGYEATVEELLNPGDPGLEPYDVVWRKHVALYEMLTLPAASGTWPTGAAPAGRRFSRRTQELPAF